MKLTAIVFLCAMPAAAANLRIGIIGTDTSHATAFAAMLNDESSPDYVPGGKVVAAFKGGSPDIESSATRVDKYAEELRTKWNVRFYDSIPELCRNVDAVLLESVDGRVHLQQVRPVIAAHKLVFIDKPLAATFADVREIDRLAHAAGVPWFSSSSLRYGEIAETMKFKDATGVATWGPGPLEPHHQLELAWYAIHPIELLYTLMGPGCEEVTRMFTPDADVIVGRWKDGRIGTVRALRPYSDYGAVVFRPKQIIESPSQPSGSYRPLVVQIMKFFATGEPPVPNQETVEIYAFMDAAQRSKDEGGRPMRLP
ncbi:MAG TPA: Gfo/Idh/MocA family oxidoreductase [Bryobacteraceae bacterium]|nr:Gfo/Idh/MocA family oxidoreductase [Bryobacteraceae bacterium]